MELLRLEQYGGEVPAKYQLATGLRAGEFACKHGWYLVNEEFFELYTEIRTALNFPLIITSGYRCNRCQAELLKAKKTKAKSSIHELGGAIDCRPILRHLLSRQARLEYLRDRLLDFRKQIRIGSYKDHIHFDYADAPNLPREWWVIKGKYYYDKDVFK